MRRPGWPTVFSNPGWGGLSHPYVSYKVVGHHLGGQPGGVGSEAPRWEMIQPDAVLEVSDGVLDLGVAAVAGLQFQGIPLPASDHGVIAVVGANRASWELGVGFTRRTMSRTGAVPGSVRKGV